MQARIEKDKLVIELPISPRPSKSGKTILIASTGGNVQLQDVQYDGKPITVGVNVYVSK